MKTRVIFSLLLCLTLPLEAQDTPKSYTLLLLDFEDRSGVQNPLLVQFNDTMDFMLSRQTSDVQVRIIPNADKVTLMARAAATQPGATLLEQGLLVSEWVGADALLAGSYTKQADVWSLQAQVYHRSRGARKAQPIQIQGNSVYQLLDEFPGQLLSQFADTGTIAITTQSWEAYEEYLRGHEQHQNYDFYGALETFNRAIQLDPTLALAYAEMSGVYAMTGQTEETTQAIRTALEWMPMASPLEQAAIRVLVYIWDVERNDYRTWPYIWGAYGTGHLREPFQLVGFSIVSNGVWNEPLIHQILAFAAMEQGDLAQAKQHHQQWYTAVQRKLRTSPENTTLLVNTAQYCFGIGEHLDEAMGMLRRAIELGPEEDLGDAHYVISRIYEQQGDIEQALDWMLTFIRHFEGFPLIPGGLSYPWDHLAESLHAGVIPAQRLLTWCEAVLDLTGLAPHYRIRTQYLLADTHQVLGNPAQKDALLAPLGVAPESLWMHLGPLDAPDLLPETPPFGELFSDMSATHPGIQGKPMQWESWDDGRPMDGLLNVWGYTNQVYYKQSEIWHFQPPSVIYSCIYVQAPEAVKVQVRTGFGILRVWLNENASAVVNVEHIQSVVMDSQQNEGSLQAGLNRFLVGTASGNMLGFYFRITDDAGHGIPGLKYVSLKEALASGQE